MTRPRLRPTWTRWRAPTRPRGAPSASRCCCTEGRCARSPCTRQRALSRPGNADASISPCTKRSRSGQSAPMLARLAQLVRVLRGEVEAVDRFKRADLFHRGRRERRLAFEGVQDDALEQVAERQIELGRERLEHLEQAALEAHPGLRAGDFFHGLMVPSYQGTIKPGCVRRTATPEAAPRAGARRK